MGSVWTAILVKTILERCYKSELGVTTGKGNSIYKSPEVLRFKQAGVRKCLSL